MSEKELFPGHFARLGFGNVPVAELAELTGLEALRRMASGAYPAPTIAERMSFLLVEVDEGRAVFKGMPDERHLNPLGGVHGGWAATIMDSALGCCVHTLLGKGEAYTTAEMKINYTRPIAPNAGVLTCEGKVVHKGRTLAVSEARLVDAEGRLLAFGTETCALFPFSALRR